MRNLKRALSLALASVMLVGMMVVGTSAASFSDVDSDHNVEAISVLQALGVMNGYDDGGFHPEANVTRNQMAMIICSLLGLDGEDFTGYRPFTDVPDWAAGAVAACEANGIVGGRGEGIYDGDAYVTGVEAAAMMLRALGYTAMPASENWETPVVAKAAEVKLFKDVGAVNGSTFLNRNAVAQVALNALKADVVKTDKEGDIIVEGVVTIPGKITYTKVEDDSVNYNGADDGTNDAKYQQLCEKLYEDKLTFTAAGEPDNFGRSASAWSFEGKEIVKVADKANRSYVGGVKTGTIYSNLSLSTKIEATNEIKVYEDGADVTASYSSSTANDIQKDGDTKYGTDGQTVEVFYNKDAADDTTKVTIVIVNTYLGIVTDDDVVEDDKDGVEITLYGEGAAANAYFYETSLYQKGDVLLVNVGRNADDEYVIEAILGEPETVSGSVTRIGKDDDLTISGKKYPQAAQFSDADGDVVVGVADTGAVTISSDATYTLYLDQNGNYLAAVEDENANITTDLVYVFSVTGGTVISGNKAEYSMFATVVRMDGTVETVPVGDKSSSPDFINSGNVTTAQTTYKQGELVDLTYDEDEDEYTIADAADYTSTDLSCTAELKADSKYAKLDGANNSYLNSKTVYLFVTADDEDTTKVDKVERIVGGVDFATTGVSGVFAKDGSNADYVVFLDSYTSSASDVIYISNDAAQGKEENGFLFKGYKDGESKEDTYPVVSLWDDGESKYVATTSGTTITAGFYEYTLDSKDGMKLKAMGEGDGIYASKAVNSVNGTMIDVADGENPYDAENVKVVDLTDASDAAENAYGRKVSTLSALKTVVDKKTGDDPTYTVTVDIYVNDDDEVLGLFITNIAEGQGGGNPPVGHTCTAEALTQQAAVPGTDCQTKGTGAYYKCSCNKMYSDDQAAHEIQAPPEGAVGAHNWNTSWESDTTNHWHTCKTANCTEKGSEAAHYKDAEGDWGSASSGDACGVCSYQKQ